MHLDEETLERVLHGELMPGARATVERHLASCRECGDRLADAARAESRVFGLLEELDHEAPPLDWEAVTRAAPRGRTARELIAASLAFLLVAGGLLHAVPGSPLRGWIDAVLGEGSGPAEPALPATDAADAPLSGIAVVPSDPFEVAFAAPQRTGRIRVTLVSSDRLELTVSGEPVELESGVDHLIVSNQGSSASYELRIPRTLSSIRVRVGAETILDKREGSIRTTAPRDSSGAYLVDLRPLGG